MPELHYVASLLVNYDLTETKLQEREHVDLLRFAQHMHQFLLYWKNDIAGIGYRSTNLSPRGCSTIPVCETMDSNGDEDDAALLDITTFLCYSDLLQLVKTNGPFYFTALSSPDPPHNIRVLRVYVDGAEVNKQWLAQRYFMGETYLTLMFHHALQRQILFFEHQQTSTLNWSQPPLSTAPVTYRQVNVGGGCAHNGHDQNGTPNAADCTPPALPTPFTPQTLLVQTPEPEFRQVVSHKRKRSSENVLGAWGAAVVDTQNRHSHESPCTNLDDTGGATATTATPTPKAHSPMTDAVVSVRLHSSQRRMLKWMQSLENKIMRGEHTINCDINIQVPSTPIVFSLDHLAFQRNEWYENTTITYPFNVGLILGERNAGKSLVVKELVCQHLAHTNRERVTRLNVPAPARSQMTRKVRGTLIVVPHTLVAQWQQYFKHDTTTLCIYDKKSFKKCSRAAIENANVIIVTHKMFLDSIINVDPLDRIQSRLFATTVSHDNHQSSSSSSRSSLSHPMPTAATSSPQTIEVPGTPRVGPPPSATARRQDSRSSPANGECVDVNTEKFHLHWFHWERVVIDELLLFILERQKSVKTKTSELSTPPSTYCAELWWGLQGNTQKDNVTVTTMFKTMYALVMTPSYSSVLSKMFDYNRAVPQCVYSAKTQTDFTPPLYIDRVVFGDLTVHETQVYETLVHLKASNDYLTNVCCGDLSCMEQYMTAVPTWLETIPKGVEALNQCLIIPDHGNGNDSESFDSDSEYSNSGDTPTSNAALQVIQVGQVSQVSQARQVGATAAEIAQVIETRACETSPSLTETPPPLVLITDVGFNASVGGVEGTTVGGVESADAQTVSVAGGAAGVTVTGEGAYLRTRSRSASQSLEQNTVSRLRHHGTEPATLIEPAPEPARVYTSLADTNSIISRLTAESVVSSTRTSPASTALDKFIAEHSSEISERRDYFLKTTGQLVTGEVRPAVCAVCLVNLCDCIFVCGHMLCHQCIIDLFESTAQDDEYADFMAPCPTCRWNVEPHEVFWVLQTPVQPPHKFTRIKQILQTTNGSTVIFATHPEILHQIYKLLIASLADTSSVSGRAAKRAPVTVQPVSPNTKMCKYNTSWYQDPSETAVGTKTAKKLKAEKPKVLFIPYSKTFGLKIQNISTVIFLHSYAGSHLQQASVEEQALQCIMPQTNQLLSVFRLRSLNTIEK